MGVSAQLVIPTTHTQGRRKVRKNKGRQIVIQYIFKEKFLNLFLSKNMGVPPTPHLILTALNYIYEKKSAEGGKLIFTYLHEPCLDISWSTERSQKVPWPMSREWVVKLNGEKPGKKRLDLTYTVSFHTQITIQYCGLFSVGPSHLILQKSAKSSQNFRSIPKM